MGLFDSYFDPEQFDASGGLLGRLISLQRQQGRSYEQYTGPRTPAPQELTSAVPGTVLPNNGVGPHSPISNFDQDAGIRNVGITSDQSIYCRTMSKLCHNECVHLALRPDGFGPYRACKRACMHNAGCYDF